MTKPIIISLANIEKLELKRDDKQHPEVFELVLRIPCIPQNSRVEELSIGNMYSIDLYKFNGTKTHYEG
jgi:hypothetical protein